MIIPDISALTLISPNTSPHSSPEKKITLATSPTKKPGLAGRALFPKEKKKDTAAKIDVSILGLLKESAKAPLKPGNINSICENDVYFSKKHPLVFKPGALAAAKGQLCYNVLKIINCKSIKPTKSVEVPQLVSGKDLETTYIKMECQDKQLRLVNKDLLYPCKEQLYGDRRHLLIRGKSYEISQKKGLGSLYLDTYTPTITPFLTQPFIKLEDSSCSNLLAPQSKVYEIFANPSGVEFIQIDTVPYKVIEKKSGSISLENAKTKEILAGRFVKIDKFEEDGNIECIVSQDHLLSVESSSDKITEASAESFIFSVTENTDGTYKVTSIAEEESESSEEDEFEGLLDDPIVLVKDINGCVYATPEDSQGIIKRDVKGEYIERKGCRYRLDSLEKGRYQLTGEDIKGMAQIKIKNAFYGTGKRAIDIKADTAERADFYSRIDLSSFIEAFLATILLRPQDGKIASLKDANYIFQIMPNSKGEILATDPTCKLKTMLIDHDEMMPPRNDISMDTRLTESGKYTIHPVRTGLMGFPQVRNELDLTTKKSVLDRIESIADKEKELTNYFSEFKKSHTDAFSEKHEVAFFEIITRLKNFVKSHRNGEHIKPFTLQDLFFYTFPEYKAQWDAIADKERPEDKVQGIGFNSIEQILARYKRRS